MSPEERKPVVAVNRQAVVERHGKAVVYLVEENRVREVLLDIDLSQIKGELIAAANLKPGQRVVIRPVGLRDGQRVKTVAQ